MLEHNDWTHHSECFPLLQIYVRERFSVPSMYYLWTKQNNFAIDWLVFSPRPDTSTVLSSLILSYLSYLRNRVETLCNIVYWIHWRLYPVPEEQAASIRVRDWTGLGWAGSVTKYPLLVPWNGGNKTKSISYQPTLIHFYFSPKENPIKNYKLFNRVIA